MNIQRLPKMISIWCARTHTLKQTNTHKPVAVLLEYDNYSRGTRVWMCPCVCVPIVLIGFRMEATQRKSRPMSAMPPQREVNRFYVQYSSIYRHHQVDEIKWSVSLLFMPIIYISLNVFAVHFILLLLLLLILFLVFFFVVIYVLLSICNIFHVHKTIRWRHCIHFNL